MTLALLPWEQLQSDLERTVHLPAEPRTAVADWSAIGKPMAIFLHSAMILEAAHRLPGHAAVNLLTELGIDARHLLTRLQQILPAKRFGPEVIMNVLADGAIDMAASADKWAWTGLLGIDIQLLSMDELRSVRLKGQKLLRWIATQDEAPSLSEVLAKLPDKRCASLILRWTTQTFALIPGFCTRRKLPTLGRPAVAYALRKRTPPVRPASQPRPSSGAMTATLVDDITAVISEIALQAVRYRQDWVWRVADAKRVCERLHSSQEVVGTSTSDRLGLAFDGCQLLSLTRQAANKIQASENGLAWLRRSAGERQHHLLERIRRYLCSAPDATTREDDLAAQMLHRATGHHRYMFDHLSLWSQLATAWREIGDDVWLRSAALAWWQRHPPQGSGLHAEASWAELVASALDGMAMPLGIIAVAGTDGGRTIRLTPAGRWALGLDAAWTPPIETALAKPVIVQADHSIVFLAPDASLEVAIGAFADRLPGAHGAGTLFTLSKLACRRAAITGLDAAFVVKVLSQASAKPLPANVVRELDGWFGRLRRAVMIPALLITTADEATATTLVALLGAVRLGPQAVSMPPNTRPGELERRLAKEGILLDTSAILRQR